MMILTSCLCPHAKAGGDEGSGSSGSQSSSSGSGGGAGEEDPGGREGGVQGEPDRFHHEGANENRGSEAHGAALCKHTRTCKFELLPFL